MPTPIGYSRPQIWLHWIVAILIAQQYLFEDYVANAWRALAKGIPYAFHPLIAAHVFGGLLIGGLVIWRLTLRLKRGAPPPPEGEHPLLKKLAHVMHWSFYALMILIPITGAVAWFGNIRPAAQLHETLTGPLLALIALHVLAALVHQFVLKTNLLARMRTPQT